MAIPQRHLDVTVGDDDAVTISATEVARLGARPGEHLQLVRSASPIKRKKVQGALVGRFDPDELLTRADFEKAHALNVQIAEEKFGKLS